MNIAKGHFLSLKVKQRSFYSFSVSLLGVQTAREPQEWHYIHSPPQTHPPQWTAGAIPQHLQMHLHMTRALSLAVAAMLTATNTGCHSGQGNTAPCCSPEQVIGSFTVQ